MTIPRVLIEEWLPVEELGLESRRERADSRDLPPNFSLHVWWARRPLVASSGVVLASLLPAWTQALADRFPTYKFLRSEGEYRAWFLRLVGIRGDIVAARIKYDAAKASGKRVPNPYTWPKAFKTQPTIEELRIIKDLLTHTWGEDVAVLDPTAGGGSIPYVASKYGLTANANDLNSVACAVLRGGVEAPALYGPDLALDIERWASVLSSRLKKRLHPYFEPGSGERVATFLFARTVPCPRTGKAVPLSPNWWIAKAKGKHPAVAVRVVTERDGLTLDQLEFELLEGDLAVQSLPDRGTVRGGKAISPWDDKPIDGDQIKQAAKRSEMGEVLYAVAVRRDGKKYYRAPTELDLECLRRAETELERLLPEWVSAGVLPDEDIPDGNKTKEPLSFGIVKWRDLFSPRQLLVHGAFVEEFRSIIPEVAAEFESDPDRGSAVLGLLACTQAKALNWNARLSSWNVKDQTIRSVFDQHNFAFKWTYAEFDAGWSLFDWIFDRIVSNYSDIAMYMQPVGPSDKGNLTAPGRVSVTHSNAGNLADVGDSSQTLVCMDPPYYSAVMYGELSDFFGVWEEATIGVVWPDLMPGGMADVKSEAVANLARFADAGRRREDLADLDYEAKMQAIFSECRRVLREDGVLTVMFTHKKARAWDALGMGLMEAGFTIETSWPVRTERDQSLHQANQNAAASSVMLVCRKRRASRAGRVYFEDLEADVRQAARDAAERFAGTGIEGVDLLLSTYGPALSVISQAWPVYAADGEEDGSSRLLRPEEALDAAREEVVRLQRRSVVGRQVEFDPFTDFTLLAWSMFKAAEFPFDDARRLALAVAGLDVDELVSAKVLDKKKGTVVLLGPKDRLRRKGDDKPGVHPEAESFGPIVIDAVHTVLYVAAEDGLAEAKALIDRAGLSSDDRFVACLQGLTNVLPRQRNGGAWVLPEAGLLDALVTAYFPEIEVPEEWTDTLDLGSV